MERDGAKNEFGEEQPGMRDGDGRRVVVIMSTKRMSVGASHRVSSSSTFVSPFPSASISVIRLKVVGS